MTWKVEKPIPTLPVSHLELGIEFYERLGFEVDWRWPDDGPTHAGLMRDGCSIMLSQCDPKAPGDVYFIVDDVSACHAAILAGRTWELAGRLARADEAGHVPPEASKRPPRNPEEHPYGLRDFCVIDPWGNCLSFGQPLGE